MKKVLFFLLAVMLSLPLTMRAQSTLTVADGTATSSYVPVYGLFCDAYLKCEYIFPEADLGDMTGSNITKMTFYLSESAADQWTGTNFQVFMQEVSATTISSYYGPANATVVYTGSLDGTGTTMEVEFDEPYTYGGGNLLIGFYNTVIGTYKSASFYGISSTSSCVRGYSYNSLSDVTTNTASFLPKTTFEYVPAGNVCLAPKELVASNITDNSADISWRYNEDASSYDIYVTNSATDIPDSNTVATSTVTDTVYSMSGLNSSTVYYVWVRTDCGDGVSKWRMVSFLTPQIAAVLPYSQDFEDATENANWTIVNGSYTNKWYIDNQITEDGSYCMYVSNDNGVNNTYTVGGAASYVWAYRDIDFDTYAGYEMTFTYRDSTEQGYDYIQIYVGPAMDPSTFGTTVPAALTQIGGRYNSATDWHNDTITMTSEISGVKRLYIYWRNDGSGGTGQAGAIDNISIEGLDCGRPLSATLGEITDNSIEFSFVPAVASDTEWDVVIMPKDSTLDESLATTIYTTTHTFTGLDANTPYDLYVRTACGSDWVKRANVRTNCALIELPYADNFDDASSSSVLPFCWAKYTTYSTYPYTTTTTNFSAPYSLYFYATSGNYNIAVMPDMESSYNVQDLSVSFMMRAGNLNYKLYVGVMDSMSANGFVALDSISVSTVNEWEEHEVALTDYVGEGNHVAFKVYGHGMAEYLYIDNVNLYTTPTCNKPFEVLVSNVTSASATIDWTPRGDETSWAVVAVEHGQDPELGTSETAYAHPYTLSGLTDNTHYDVYVKALCGAGDESVWSTSVDFTTKCLATDVIPYTEGFDGLGGAGVAYFPSCWTRHTNNTTNYPYVSTSYHYDGTSALHFYNSSSTNWCYAATQGLNLSQYEAGTLMLNFKLRTTSTSYGRMDIGITTDADDISSMTVLKSIYPGEMTSTSTWYDYNVALPSQYEDVVYIVFSAPAGVEYNAMYLDAVNLSVPACSSPSNLTVSNIAGTSAMVNWTAAPIAVDDYVLEYTEAGQENWVSTITAETSTILSGLTEQTSYNLRVYSNCDEGETDTLTVNFSTKCNAGGEIAIGSGTATSYLIPVNNYYHYTYSQQLFLASELSGPATINSIAFEYAYSTASTSKPNCTIYLGHTTQSSFTSTSDYIPLSDLHQVYQGNLNCQQGWNTFALDSVFQYDGTSNLVLVVDDNSDAFNGQSYTFRVHTAPFTSTLHYYSDSSNPDPSDPTSAGANSSTTNSRNNVIFGGDCDTATCIAPNIYDITADAESITLQWVPGLSETSWEVRYQAMGETDWTVETVSESPYTIEGLVGNTNYIVGVRSNCGSSEYSQWTTRQISTTCSDITLPYTQDFESATGSSYECFIDCWTRGTNYTYNYPYVSTQSASPSGTKALYFYATTSNYSYAATNRLADEIEMDSLLISLYAYKTTASYSIEVGIMTDPTNKNTFVPIATISPSTTYTWENIEVRTSNYTGEGRYVAFRAPQGATSYMYIDGINIDYIPSCSHVEDITLEDATSSTLTISWTAGGDESNWVYAYGPTGTIDPEDEEVVWIPTAEDTVLIDNLEPNTAYDIYIKASCDNGVVSAPWSATFRTECVAITASALPYIEDFDDYGTSTSATLTSAYPYCWSRISSVSTERRPYCSTSAKYSGVAGLYFYISSSSAYEYAIAPELSEDLDITTLQAKFMEKVSSSSYTGRLIVGVMTDPSNIQTFVPVDTVNANGNTNWTEKTVSFANYTGTGKYIAFKHNYSSYDGVYIDHFVLDVIPACDAPTEVAISNLSATGADLTWASEESESQWQVYYCAADQNPDFTLAETVTTNSYSFSSLDANTVYTAYVRTVCSNGQGYSEWNMVTFMTPSDNPAQTPYFHDFNNETENDEWVILNGNQTNKWYIAQPTEETKNVLFVSQNGTAETYNVSSLSAVWAYRDIHFGDAAEFNLSFNWKTVGESTYDYLKVYLGAPAMVTAGNLEQPAGSVQIGGTLNGQNSWQNYSAVLDASYANTTQRLYFLWRNDESSGSNPAAVVDSIQITTSDCGHPFNITVDNVTTTSCDVTFQPAMSTDVAWEYVYCTLGGDPELETPTSITSTNFTLSGLTPATYYNVYVRTSCSGGESSDWESIRILTDCDIFNLPYTENFNSYTTDIATSISAPAGFPNITMPSCWTFLNNSTSTSNYPQMFMTSYATYAVSGNCLFFKSSQMTPAYAILPEMDEDIQNMQMSFTYRNEGVGAYNGTLYLGYMTDPSDASTFVSLYTCAQTQTKTTVEFDFDVVSDTVEDAYIAFKYQGGSGSNYYASIDDIFVGLIPTCKKPVNPQASGATTTTVSLSWTEEGTATAWNIEYGPAGFTQGEGTVVAATSNPYTLTGLTASTSYDFYVQADCQGGDVSDWSTVAHFATECETIDVFPYTEGFENGGNMPACWSQIGTADWEFQEGAHLGDISSAHSGSYNAMLYNQNNESSKLITPVFDLTQVSNPYVTFWHGQQVWISDQDELTVYYRTSATASWIELTSYTSSISTWTFDSLALPNPSATYQLAFEGEGNFGYGVVLDDITIAGAGGPTPPTPGCDVPTNVAASNVTYNSASINWTAGGTENAWNLQYKKANQTTWSNSIAVTARPYTLSGLDAQTAYNVRVQANCGADGTSEWSTVANFTTAATPAEPCDAPTGLTVSNITTTTAVVTWTPGGDENAWNVQYKLTSASEWNNAPVSAPTYTIEGLTAESNYTVQVQAKCSETNLSGWVSTTFTTQGTGISNVELANSISIMPNPAESYIELTINSNVNVKEASIYNAFGQLIQKLALNDNHARIDVSAMAAGMYFVRIANDNTMATKKFIKK